MPLHTRDIGDSRGQGHELKVACFEDGNVILYSNNPDSGEKQRIVLMEDQWRLLLQSLLEAYGKDKCCFFDDSGMCMAEAHPL
ncbi:hypothetical protein LK12_05295 [Novosphingobium malaysiense]|uniref:Uncharacterized protein n=1 Tax=Novosphingobium malaysiense TaxID=1348853 RepID=A0A0B1ZSY9_9SPHN|nr:hypothetical protein LK12_05295 [Novosphingobium malaysiense]